MTAHVHDWDGQGFCACGARITGDAPLIREVTRQSGLDEELGRRVRAIVDDELAFDAWKSRGVYVVNVNHLAGEEFHTLDEAVEAAAREAGVS